jgi:hypothetical protein
LRSTPIHASLPWLVVLTWFTNTSPESTGTGRKKAALPSVSPGRTSSWNQFSAAARELTGAL